MVISLLRAAAVEVEQQSERMTGLILPLDLIVREARVSLSLGAKLKQLVAVVGGQDTGMVALRCAQLSELFQWTA